jgi:hypothetical protein
MQAAVVVRVVSLQSPLAQLARAVVVLVAEQIKTEQRQQLTQAAVVAEVIKTTQVARAVQELS